MLHRLYFSPGMFGFGRLASYDYFAHLEEAIAGHLRAAGDEVETYVLDVAPTASVRRRAGKLAELVERTCTSGSMALSLRGDRLSLTHLPLTEDDQGPIHLVGHSTGGLDARLVATPDVNLPVGGAALAWLPRLASVTTINTPHHGTPLASFFATVSGHRLLYALSALTFIALAVGSPPLAAVSALVVAISRAPSSLGMDVRVLERATQGLLGVIDDARSADVRAWLDAIQEDQGAILQLAPEAMELFHAGVGDRPGVHYQSTASMAPPPSLGGWLRRTPTRWLGTLREPWFALSGAIFATLHGLTARHDEAYPCGPARADDAAEGLLTRVFGRAPGARANDGVVPVRSQIWGRLVWTGHADHLDVLGHFGERTDARSGAGASLPAGPVPHVDWLTSGAGFDRPRFAAMTRAIADGMLGAARSRRP